MRTRASASLTAISAASTSSSYSAGSTRTKASFADIDPPWLNCGETQITRPSTWDATFTLPSSLTEPVSRTDSACRVGAGRTTLTAGLAFSSVTSGATSRTTRSGARAKKSATATATTIRISWR